MEVGDALHPCKSLCAYLAFYQPCLSPPHSSILGRELLICVSKQVFGHHPVLNNHMPEWTKELVDNLAPVLEAQVSTTQANNQISTLSSCVAALDNIFIPGCASLLVRPRTQSSVPAPGECHHALHHNGCRLKGENACTMRGLHLCTVCNRHQL